MGLYNLPYGDNQSPFIDMDQHGVHNSSCGVSQNLYYLFRFLLPEEKTGGLGHYFWELGCCEKSIMT